jgi:hypothetical protein
LRKLKDWSNTVESSVMRDTTPKSISRRSF